MKFLIDNALSFVISEELKKLGYDAVHVRDIGLESAEDQAIFEKAKEENRTIISADTDFGYLLSHWKGNKPSVIVFRKGSERNPFQQVELLKLNLTGQVLDAIEEGSIIIIETHRIRIRTLPIYND